MVEKGINTQQVTEKAGFQTLLKLLKKISGVSFKETLLQMLMEGAGKKGEMKALLSPNVSFQKTVRADTKRLNNYLGLDSMVGIKHERDLPAELSGLLALFTEFSTPGGNLSILEEVIGVQVDPDILFLTSPKGQGLLNAGEKRKVSPQEGAFIPSFTVYPERANLMVEMSKETEALGLSKEVKLAGKTEAKGVFEEGGMSRRENDAPLFKLVPAPSKKLGQGKAVQDAMRDKSLTDIVIPLDESRQVYMKVVERVATLKVINLSMSMEEEVVTQPLSVEIHAQVEQFKELVKAYLVERGVKEETAGKVADQIKGVVVTILREEKPIPITTAKVIEEEKPLLEKGRLEKEAAVENRREILWGNKATPEAKVVPLQKASSRIEQDKRKEMTSPSRLLPESQVIPVGEELNKGEKISGTKVEKSEDILPQITRAVEANLDKGGRVKVILEPPHLGEVEMEVVVRGDRVRAVMVAENGEVRQVLKSHAEEIKQVLADQGLRLERIEIRTPEEKQLPPWAGNGGEGDNGGSYRRHHGRQDKKNSKDDDAFANHLILSV